MGIEKEYYQKIFGMFEGLHQREDHDGTGAWLYICKNNGDTPAKSLGGI